MDLPEWLTVTQSILFYSIAEITYLYTLFWVVYFTDFLLCFYSHFLHCSRKQYPTLWTTQHFGAEQNIPPTTAHILMKLGAHIHVPQKLPDFLLIPTLLLKMSTSNRHHEIYWAHSRFSEDEPFDCRPHGVQGKCYLLDPQRKTRFSILWGAICSLLGYISSNSGASDFWSWLSLVLTIYSLNLLLIAPHLYYFMWMSFVSVWLWMQGVTLI